MNTIFRPLPCVLALAGGLTLASGPGLRAGEPARTAPGKVLVLDNDATLEGDIERVGDRYRVRRSVGETWIPADRAARLCDSKEDALAFLRRRANLDDPDERLRLARWCHLHGLRDQALAEARAALGLRPGHEESRRLVQYLGQPDRPAGGAAAAAPAARPQSPAPPVEL